MLFATMELILLANPFKKEPLLFRLSFQETFEKFSCLSCIRCSLITLIVEGSYRILGCLSGINATFFLTLFYKI